MAKKSAKPKKIERKEIGRPTIFTQELADDICARLASGKSLRSVCLDEKMPDASTIFRWIRTDEEFCKQYARAKEESTDALAEEIIDLSDDAVSVIHSGPGNKSGALAQAVRLQVDTRKWIMSKMKPKKYGDKLDMTSDGKALPTPIFDIKNVLPDNSNGENSETVEED